MSVETEYCKKVELTCIEIPTVEDGEQSGTPKFTGKYRDREGNIYELESVWEHPVSYLAKGGSSGTVVRNRSDIPVGTFLALDLGIKFGEYHYFQFVERPTRVLSFKHGNGKRI